MVAEVSVEIERAGVLLTHGGVGPTRYLVAPTKWRAGRDYNTQQLGRSVVGSASIQLLNNGGEWDQVRSGDLVRIYLDSVQQWGGYVDKAVNSGKRTRLVRHLRCLGALGYMQALKVVIPAQRDISLQDGITQLWDVCGVPAAYRGSVTGDHVFPVFYVGGCSGKDAAHILETSVRGFLYEDRQGRINLESQVARIGAGPLVDIRRATSSQVNDNFERRVTGYEGSVLIPRIGDVEVIAELSADTGNDLPVLIDPGRHLRFPSGVSGNADRRRA